MGVSNKRLFFIVSVYKNAIYSIEKVDCKGKFLVFFRLFFQKAYKKSCFIFPNGLQ